MKIFDREQISRWDLNTIEKQGITATALMQRAGARCAQWIKKKFDRKTLCYIIVGKGGNGGDGLVIARSLLHAGYTIKLLLTSDPIGYKGATKDNWQLLQRELSQYKDGDNKQLNAPEVLKPASSRPSGLGNLEIYHMEQLGSFQLALNNKKPSKIIIDALLGTGFNANRTESKISDLIQYLNETRLPIIAIDMPSGLMADRLPEAQPEPHPLAIIMAKHTLSFQAYKRSFLHPEAGLYTGQVHILDIGLSKGFRKKEPTINYVTDFSNAVKLYHNRAAQSFGHKGSFGTVAIVGGSYGKIGAVALSAKAALRAGAGKVFIQAPRCGNEILQTALPEAMFEPVGDSYISGIKTVDKTTYGIGPGMDTHPESITVLTTFLEGCSAPVVLDADALNCMATDMHLFLPLIAKGSILTPHPGEFNRLFGKKENSMEQIEIARRVAKQGQFIIVLKGHHTAICSEKGDVYYNLSGNAGMATAGSGDVLTGIITSLLAQGYPSIKAARLGVYLHGLAGDYYVKRLGAQESLIAGDLIDCLGKAFRKLNKNS